MGAIGDYIWLLSSQDDILQHDRAVRPSAEQSMHGIAESIPHPTIFMELPMPLHQMSEADYMELLRLTLREANGEAVIDRLSQHPPARVRWIREWSMLLGYVELTALRFDPTSPTGLVLPVARLSESGRTKLAEINRAPTLATASQKSGHLMWVPADER